MSATHHHDPVEALRRTPHPLATAQRPGAVLVPFPGPDARRMARTPRGDERRGEILLFLGVRYERLAS